MAQLRRIDAHQHVLFDEYLAELETMGVTGSAERSFPPWSKAQMLENMAAYEIDAVAVSISSPGTYFGDIDFTKGLVRLCNDCFADLSDQAENRIVSLGLLPLPDTEAACRELDYIYDELKWAGVALQRCLFGRS